MAMLTGDKKPVEIEEGEQLSLETGSTPSEPIIPEQSADAQPMGEVRPDEEKLNKPEVSDGTYSMESQ